MTINALVIGAAVVTGAIVGVTAAVALRDDTKAYSGGYREGYLCGYQLGKRGILNVDLDADVWQ